MKLYTTIFKFPEFSICTQSCTDNNKYRLMSNYLCDILNNKSDYSCFTLLYVVHWLKVAFMIPLMRLDLFNQAYWQQKLTTLSPKNLVPSQGNKYNYSKSINPRYKTYWIGPRGEVPTTEFDFVRCFDFRRRLSDFTFVSASWNRTQNI